MRIARSSFQTDFSIGHRGGGALQFPEHIKESHEAGARMGAGVLECDVTFTNDGELVCRHDQCDLHTTTNILVTDLAGKCSVPFSPAIFDASGTRTKAASALCCTSDLTLAEFKSLKGKMDASDPNATTPQAFQGGTANWRTDLYATGGTLLSHKESIQLIKSLGAKYTPELKGPNRSAQLQVEDVFGSQEGYAQALIDDYKEAGIPPKEVFAQSFNRNDVLYWIQHEPQFGEQAVYLDDRYETITPPLDPKDPSDLDTQHAGTGQAGHQDHRAADVGAVDGGERQDCPFSLCQGGQGRWARHHHLDDRAVGAYRRRRAADQGYLEPVVLLSVDA